MKIVLPGGSGQIGTVLARHFHRQGHTVTVLSRDPKPASWQVMRWDAQTVGPWTAALEQSDLCITLTGRSVNGHDLSPRTRSTHGRDDRGTRRQRTRCSRYMEFFDQDRKGLGSSFFRQ